MNYSTLFLVMACVLIAPHLSLFDGKLISMICLAIGVVFWAVEWWLE